MNIADLAAFETWPAYVPHGISKAGVVHMTRALARVLAPEVRVDGIAPGTVLLPESGSRGRRGAARADDAARAHRHARGRGRAVLFILESDYLTGETIIVDGGRHVRC